MKNEILKKITDIINHLKDEDFNFTRVNSNSTFTYEFGLDSMDLLTLIVEVENFFEIMISDIDLDISKINNIDFFVSKIENELKKGD
ncbi:MAG: hypothetical protein IJ220_06705 [Clostridia bacterium]|nr:hypothetical protein [Clostridia bacterium]